ncbi:MAG: hypothetical protein A3F47_02330 [Candidatus Staskawiczbacteria bacterium RIFCSPHIGHO2_12_FULL_38_11]|uniref:Uncharacterized protein n=1 Tax=Candidatus Staskawiczbacteria bacterium RIFCSPHIGHO2_12_FULL_38_11 TaxID=1802209 RepID=A0A1G2I5K2_9BACT|nr:MAG: hypothetical protein A3F47_02330 [Candidatus Staskawiczbacteria bacterium RIFCSPHIGHO2_12_FULL_38_11]
MKIQVQMSREQWVNYCKTLLLEIEKLNSGNTAFIDTQIGSLPAPYNQELTKQLARALNFENPKNRGDFNIFISNARKFLELIEKSKS